MLSCVFFFPLKKDLEIFSIYASLCYNKNYMILYYGTIHSKVLPYREALLNIYSWAWNI